MRGGHWIQLDEPELVTDAVRELIATANKRM
jgi:pimeloyl-ACP methyl ester carboxylesterase